MFPSRPAAAGSADCGLLTALHMLLALSVAVSTAATSCSAAPPSEIRGAETSAHDASIPGRTDNELLTCNFDEGVCAAQDADVDDDEHDEFATLRPGLLAQYSDATGTRVERIDSMIAFSGGMPLDERLEPQRLQATWSGKLLIQLPGTYHLHAYAAGRVSLLIDGEVLLDVQSADASWHVAKPVELTFGYHALQVVYEATGDETTLKLAWEGPNFRFEPVSEQFLFHDGAERSADLYGRGRDLVRALRCGSCHDGWDANPLPAPSLASLRGQIREDWLERWIADPHSSAKATATSSATEDEVTDPVSMPSYELTGTDARAIAACLLASADVQLTPPPRPPRGDADKGREHFLTLGCLACHTYEALGRPGLFGGGTLTGIGDKRPPHFFERWLRDPASLNAAHRMPVYSLDDEVLRDLTTFLAEQVAKKPEEAATAKATNGGASADANTPNQMARGRELIARLRCGACHQLPRQLENEIVTRIDVVKSIAVSDANWSQACTGKPHPPQSRPGYRLSDADVAAIRQYLQEQTSLPKSGSSTPQGERVLAERNCLGCHRRGLASGNDALLTELAAHEPKLAVLLPVLKPPAITGVGDKLDAAALRAAITTQRDGLRPWLSIKMPRFALSEQEAAALTDYFVARDRVPPREPPKADSPSKAFEIAGRRLVTADGFGCTSCHQIGSQVPQRVALNARGTDLSRLSKRVRREWFDRWVRNPVRIVAQMEMPSIQLPVRGVLDDDLDAQLAAVWHVLSLADFEPPPADAVRVVRRRHEAGVDEPAVVLTDVLRAGGQTFIKPLVIGLPNRHNVLFDLQRARMAGWWLGDTARQRTEGKTWYWEPAGTPVLAPGTGPADVRLVSDSRVLTPQSSGQFPVELDWWEMIDSGVRFGYRLRVSTESSASQVALRVVEEVLAFDDTSNLESPSGVSRRIRVEGAPTGAVVQWTCFRSSSKTKLSIEQNGAVASLSTDAASVRVIAREQGTKFERASERDSVLLASASGGEPVEFAVDYYTELPNDRFLNPPVPPFPVEVVLLESVPGYEAAQLAIGDDLMPTGFAWMPDGRLAVSSLKGRVWLGQDTDGDGLEDRLAVFAEGLAAPYGLAITADGAVDCIHKAALVRLTDADDDGTAERAEIIADGWGHTDDYHDWAVGLPRDPQGNYVLALPCQQDERTDEAAIGRGTALQLLPRQPTADNPRRYRWETICAGLRFPMGLAFNRAGDLFASDNQGHYNPFNELNHLLPGAHYKFLNALERAAGMKSTGLDPAINIPHPWTRSVNGICFLDTPRSLGPAPHFGPFEGHLLGCEYDTRRLVRMSLEQVDGRYQGAAYPFSTMPTEDAQPWLQGPIVCAIAPDGDIYVGNIRDSGWGGGTNVGSIVRLRPTGALPAGIAEVRASRDGFVVHLTQPVDRAALGDPALYHVSSYRRESTPAYGGPDLARRDDRVTAVSVSGDGLQVELTLDGLRPGFVYELRMDSPLKPEEPFFPAEAYYTLHRIPAGAAASQQ